MRWSSRCLNCMRRPTAVTPSPAGIIAPPRAAGLGRGPTPTRRWKIESGSPPNETGVGGSRWITSSGAATLGRRVKPPSAPRAGSRRRGAAPRTVVPCVECRSCSVRRPSRSRVSFAWTREMEAPWRTTSLSYARPMIHSDASQRARRATREAPERASTRGFRTSIVRTISSDGGIGGGPGGATAPGAGGRGGAACGGGGCVGAWWSGGGGRAGGAPPYAGGGGRCGYIGTVAVTDPPRRGGANEEAGCAAGGAAGGPLPRGAARDADVDEDVAAGMEFGVYKPHSTSQCSESTSTERRYRSPPDSGSFMWPIRRCLRK